MKKILVIEDELALRESIKLIIEVNNFVAFTAANGTEGLNVLQNRGDEIDLILCDINMPDISGYDILREVKAHPTLYKVPFVFLTAFADKTEVRKGMDMGADDYLTKPFAIKDLINAINSRIELSSIKESKYREEINKSWISILNTNFRQDFYTPLNGILNATHFLGNTQQPVDAATFRTTMRNIYFSSFRMYRDTRNLMLYSMMNTGQKLVHENTLFSTDLNSVLKDIMSYYDVALENNEMMLFREIERVDVLTHDTELISVLFTELIDNTIKFSTPGHAPVIRLHAEGNHFNFSAENHCAFAPQFTLGNVSAFTKFHKDESLNGLGIGLYICKALSKMFDYSLKMKVEEHKVTFMVTNSVGYTDEE